MLYKGQERRNQVRTDKTAKEKKSSKCTCGLSSLVLGLMGGCKETLHAQCCHSLGVTAAFTAELRKE